MVAKNAIQLSAQTLNGATALLVEKMGSKLHGNAVELLESVRQ
jgi:hypothetical protein